jgi:hypothetical protein
VPDRPNSSIYALMQRSVDRITESIAKEGVDVLVQVLEREGFTKSPYLKDFQVFAHVTGGEICFDLELNIDAFDDDTVTQLRESNEDSEPEEDATKESKTFGRNKFNNVGRLLSYRDSRVDARKRSSNSLTPKALPAKTIRTPVVETSENRKLKHSLAAHAPRSALISSQTQKVSLRLKTMVNNREDDTKSEFVYRNKQFEGVIGRFVDELSVKVSEVFSEELSELMGKYL